MAKIFPILANDEYFLQPLPEAVFNYGGSIGDAREMPPLPGNDQDRKSVV